MSQQERAIIDEIRHSEGLLSPTELRQIRTKYHLLQTDMEQILGAGPKAWTRWERGKVSQSKSTDLLLRVFGSNPVFAQCMMDAAGVDNPKAREEVARAEVDFNLGIQGIVRERLGKVEAPNLSWIDKVTETSLLVSREKLGNSLNSAEDLRPAAA